MLAGRYSLERELGRGGMGVVYLAREVRLDRPVAIKLLPPDLAAFAPLRERFLREARTAAKLAHPHIVPIHAVDEVGRFVFYVMAYVRGDTLAQRIARRGPLPPREAGRVLREVAWALAHAHAAGVVHRDIKPENILLEEGSGRALVTDFGIARELHASGPTAAGETLGTPDFMSPEQASGDTVDPRSDVYSLGIVGFYTLSGRLPFGGSTAAARMAQHVTQTPPTLPAVVPGVPKPLAAVIGRCLNKAPDARYPDGGVLAEAISLALERRREPPGALRMYLAEADTISAHRLFPSFLLGGMAIWVVLELTLSPILAPAGPFVDVLLTVVRLSVLAGAVLGPLGLTLHRLRRVIAAGHDHEELLRALAADADRLREDFTAIHGRPPRPRQGLRHRIWMGATAICGTLGAMALLQMEWPLPALTGALAGVSSAIALFGSGLAWRASVFGGFRLRFWASPAGRFLFRLAGLGRRAVPPAADRPTELALGLAAEALFTALPGHVRRALPELPDVVRRLQRDAQRMRRRCEALSETLAGVEASPAAAVAGSDAGLVRRRESLVGDLRGAHAAAQQRLAAAVAALEAIRLDLLRLRGGVGSVESITADLAAARELAAETDRLLAARQEAEDVAQGHSR